MTDIDYDDPFLALRYAIDRHQSEARRIRQLVLEQVDRGVSRREVARRIGMKPSTVANWIDLARQERDGESANRHILQSRRTARD
ncbi:helix-turn-helix domain-containing protein [Curtobacterium flaccumfaciens]|uniref:helix-turn-helix domain-containing protein n=1 Tax=Curtobacterium flaccumfaciens TaxID=2035 RepID=UPI0021FF3C26|nr:helix-turn-helix domain-containing protein [Curtobacterium flaccumfaciens]UWD79220.1 helix-turn-helix domain-containing protein [Curtobacterium flaccumfaciens]